MPTSSQEVLRVLIVHHGRYYCRTVPALGNSLLEDTLAAAAKFSGDWLAVIGGVPIRRFEHTLDRLQGPNGPNGEALERSTNG